MRFVAIVILTVCCLSSDATSLHRRKLGETPSPVLFVALQHLQRSFNSSTGDVAAYAREEVEEELRIEKKALDAFNRYQANRH